MKTFLYQLKCDLESANKKTSIPSIIKNYALDPGFFAIANHRIIYRLCKINTATKILSKILWRINTGLTSCHIHPTAEIAEGVTMPHPTSIVIGSGVIIEKNCTIYQCTTIGTNNKYKTNYPRIGSNTTIYANSTIIGNIKIGDNCIIGANSLISKDIPDDSTAKSNFEIILNENKRSQ